VSQKYLLPCACGRQYTIEPRQAGTTIHCACGGTLDAPTMMQITALEPVPPEDAVPSSLSAWGTRHRMGLVGVVLMIVGALGLAALALNHPVPQVEEVDVAVLRREAERLPPAVTWRYWEMLKRGLDQQIDEKYAAAMDRYRIGQGASSLVALVGAALLAAALVRRRQ
jgi:hypothetical protein